MCLALCQALGTQGETDTASIFHSGKEACRKQPVPRCPHRLCLHWSVAPPASPVPLTHHAYPEATGLSMHDAFPDPLLTCCGLLLLGLSGALWVRDGLCLQGAQSTERLADESMLRLQIDVPSAQSVVHGGREGAEKFHQGEWG